MKQDNEIFQINVNLNGFLLPLHVSRSTDPAKRLLESPEELTYRKAEKLFNSLMEKRSKTYNQRPMEQIVKLVAFELAVALTKGETSEDESIMAQRIQSLDDELKELLSQE
jgi:hypothetical protein